MNILNEQINKEDNTDWKDLLQKKKKEKVVKKEFFV